MCAKKKEPVFQDIIEGLEEIVSKMETGELSLEDSLTAFKEGVELVKKGSKQLDEVEQQVSILMKDVDGKDIEMPFEDEEE